MSLARSALFLLVAPTMATTTIKLGLEWFLNPDHLPLVVALREGYFADAGLDVQLIAPADHWEAEEEILAGRLDVAVTETLHLAQDAAKGKPVMGFSRFLHTDGEPPTRKPSHAQALPNTRQPSLSARLRLIVVLAVRGRRRDVPGLGQHHPSQGHVRQDDQLPGLSGAGRSGDRADDGRGRRRLVRPVELR